jgi:hypothetical protein
VQSCPAQSRPVSRLRQSSSNARAPLAGSAAMQGGAAALPQCRLVGHSKSHLAGPGVRWRSAAWSGVPEGCEGMGNSVRGLC